MTCEMRQLHVRMRACDMPHACIPPAQVIGTVLMPGISMAGSGLEAAAPAPLGCSTCTVCALEDVPGVLLVLAQYRLAHEQCGAWARGLLPQLGAQHVVALGELSAEAYRGPGGSREGRGGEGSSGTEHARMHARTRARTYLGT